MLDCMDERVMTVLMLELENLGDAMSINTEQYDRATDLIDQPESNEIEIISRVMFAAQSILTVAALVSKLLLPPPKRPQGCKCELAPEQEADYARIKRRCTELKKALGIKGDLPPEIKSRTVRNHLEHFDTRIDKFFAENPDAEHKHRVVAPADMFPANLALRHVDYRTHTITVLGDSVSLVAMKDAVYDIAVQARQWLNDHEN